MTASPAWVDVGHAAPGEPHCPEVTVIGGREWVCVRRPHAVPAPEPETRFDQHGAYLHSEPTASDKHYFRPRRAS